MAVIVKTTPAEALALVRKFEARLLEAQSDVDAIQTAHRNAILDDMEGGDPKANVLRTKLQKDLEAAQIELADLTGAVESARTRHAEALSQAASDEKARDEAEVRRLGAVALKIGATVEKLALDLMSEFNKLVDVSKQMYALAPYKDCLYGDSPLSEVVLAKHLRQFLFKNGAKWAFRYFWDPSTIKPFSDAIAEGNAWITKFENSEPTGNLGRIRRKIYLPPTNEVGQDV